MNNTEIKGKPIIVTGGTTGIGRAIAYQLAEAGASVIIVGQNAEHLDDALQNAEQTYADRFQGILADLATEEGIQRLFEEVDQKFEQVDILINNAALGAGAVADSDYQEISKVIQTNLTAYLACSHQAIQRMKQSGSGHIINIGSMSAHTKEEGSSIYVAAKSGIQGFSESLRKEVNQLGIKVTLIEPGAVDTDMQEASHEEKEENIKQLKMLTADDIAAAVTYAAVQPLRCDVVTIQLRPHLQVI